MDWNLVGALIGPSVMFAGFFAYIRHEWPEISYARSAGRALSWLLGVALVYFLFRTALRG